MNAGAKYGMVVLCLAGLVALGGCLGAAPPVRKMLRVAPSSSDNACGGGFEAADTPESIRLAVKELTVMDGLDRQAVLIASDNVLTPSLQWYWEGSPEALTTDILLRNVNCLPGFVGVAPYRPRVEHDAVLAGDLGRFNIQKQGGVRFAVAFSLELWSRNQRRLLASKRFTASAPVAAMAPADVAVAAGAAVGQAMGEVDDWLKGLRALIEGAAGEKSGE